MKSNVNKITSLLCTWVLLVAVITVISNKIFNTHIHQLSNGSWVYHAHPYNKTDDSKPIKSHTHTANELTFFQVYYNFLVAFFTIASVLVVATKKIGRQLVLEKLEPQLCFDHHKGRSPPTACMLSA